MSCGRLRGCGVRCEGVRVVRLEVDVVDAGDASLLLAGLGEEFVELLGVVAEEDGLHEGFLEVAFGYS